MCIAMGSIASMLITIQNPIEAEQLIKGNDVDDDDDDDDDISHVAVVVHGDSHGDSHDDDDNNDDNDDDHK